MMRFFVVFLLALPAFAVERPATTLNGYIPQHGHPVLIEEDGDTLDPSWSGKTAYTVPIPADSSPTCSGGSGLEDGEYWIRDENAINQLSQSVLAARIFWVCPGDWTGGSGNEIDIADSGAGSADNQIVKVMCYVPGDQAKNPYQRNPSATSNRPAGAHAFTANHDPSEECMLPRIDVNGEDHWFWHNITFVEEQSATPDLLDMDNADNWVFDRTWHDCSKSIASTSDTSHRCINIDDNVSGLVMQNFLIGPGAPVYDSDTIGFDRTSNTGDLYLVSGDIFNMGMHVKTGSVVGSGPGMIVEDVSAFFTPGMRLSTSWATSSSNWYAAGVKCASGRCSGNGASNPSERLFDPLDPAFNGAFDPSGVGACGAQSMFSIKYGGTSADPMRVIHSRISGNRGMSVRCLGDGSGRGAGFGFQEYPRNFVLENSIVWDVRRGLQYNPASKATNADYTGQEHIQNIMLLGDFDDTPLGRTDDRRTVSFGQSCINDCQTLSSEFDFRFNTFGPVPSVGGIGDVIDDISGTQNGWDCNKFGDDTTVGTGSPPGSDNVEIANANVWSSLSNTLRQSTLQAAETEYCFWDRLQTDPVEVCLPNIRPTSTSGYLTNCRVSGPATYLDGAVRGGISAPGALSQEAPQALPTEARINIGGDAYVDGSGNTWQACNTSSGAPCSQVSYAQGNFYLNPTPVNGTTDDLIFQSITASFNGNPTNIAIDLEPGNYTVKLLFNEAYYDNPGLRVFNVSIEGVSVETDFDIIVEAGARHTALVKTYTNVDVSDGQLNVQLTHGSAENPTIAGIEAVFATTPDPGVERPLEINGYVPPSDHMYSVILPWSGDTLRAGYSGEIVDTNCDYTFTSNDDTKAEIEAIFATEGPNFCLPVTTDWKTSQLSIDIDGIDCQTKFGDRCWIMPADIGSRDKTAKLMAQNPEFWQLRFINGAASWGVIGLKCDHDRNGPSSCIDFGDGATPGHDFIASYNWFTEWGHPSTAGTKAAIRVLNSYDFVITENIADSSATSDNVLHPQGGGGIDFVQIDRARQGGEPTGPVDTLSVIAFNTCYDTGGSCAEVSDSSTQTFQVPNLRVVSNDFFRSGAYRNLAEDTGGPPNYTNNGQGPYDCYEDLIDLGNGSTADNFGLVANNLVHGARDVDPRCNGSGANGEAMTIRRNAANHWVTQNLFFDNVSGITYPEPYSPSALAGSEYTANLFHVVDGTGGFVDPGTYSTYNQSYAYKSDANASNYPRFSFNTVYCENLPAAAPVPVAEPVTGPDLPHEVRYNLTVNCPQWGDLGTLTWQGDNAFTDTPLNPANSSETEVVDSQNRPTYTDVTIFTRLCHHWTEQCPQITFPKVVPTVGGPLDGAITPSWISSAGLQTPGHVPIQSRSEQADGTYGAFVPTGTDVTPPDPVENLDMEIIGESGRDLLRLVGLWTF